MTVHAQPGTLKEQLFREFRGYWLIVGYLALVFGAFVQYRRLVLASHDIEYGNYFIAVIKAMVLGKVIMIGDALRLARGMDRRPLIWPTLYKSLVFSLFLAAFALLEYGVKGWWKGGGFAGGVRDFFARGWPEVMGGVLVVLVSLIPFFAFREIGGVLGRGRLMRLFFSDRNAV